MNKSESIKLRLEPEEKEAFLIASKMAELSLSKWMRERLRKAALTELQYAGKQVPFLK